MCGEEEEELRQDALAKSYPAISQVQSIMVQTTILNYNPFEMNACGEIALRRAIQCWARDKTSDVDLQRLT